MTRMTYYRSPMAFPPAPERSSFLVEAMSRAGFVPVLEPLSAFDVGAALFSRQPPANCGYPRTRTMARFLSFAGRRPAACLTGAQVFLDALAHVQHKGLEVAMVTSNRPAFQEFRRQVARMVPGLSLHLQVESFTANTRRDDATALLAKIHPGVVYLGPDIVRRREWAARILAEVQGVQAILLGHRDFELYTRPSRVGRGPAGAFGDFIEETRSNPLSLLTLPVTGLMAVDALRMKWLKKQAIEET